MKREAIVEVPSLTLDRRRPLPSQIAAAIRAAIQTGRLRAGDRLPASRALAREIGVARPVAVVAYEQLPWRRRDICQEKPAPDPTSPRRRGRRSRARSRSCAIRTASRS